jgi:hypothetical protein
MSQDTDRIAVPTNGRGPHPVAAPVAPPAAPGEVDQGAPSDEEMSTAFTPKNLAIGFGILASLVLLLVGAVRRRRPGA